jgi:hypothetical protein
LKKKYISINCLIVEAYSKRENAEREREKEREKTRRKGRIYIYKLISLFPPLFFYSM